MDDELRDLLSEFAGGVESTAAKVGRRLVEIGRLKDAGDILRRAELLTDTLKRTAGSAGLRVDLAGDETR